VVTDTDLGTYKRDIAAKAIHSVAPLLSHFHLWERLIDGPIYPPRIP